MLVKEYRIPLPLSLEEYRIAQLYMIQKKSRLESTGSGSAVEIIENTPYNNGPGASGQYTKKIYHIGSHLPSWLKSLLPKTALCVEEEAWNAYPYTKTRHTCPFIGKFFIDIETHYLADYGQTENVFQLSKSERKNIEIDTIDPVKDAFPQKDYEREEDPSLFKSTKTGRGPLDVNWLEKYRKGEITEPIMCAYKLIRVEFKYWGMQTKIEQFIQNSLRNPMLVGHRQAWSWQDEWFGLTIGDIRELEKQTQIELTKRMGKLSGEMSDDVLVTKSSQNKSGNENMNHKQLDNTIHVEVNSDYETERDARSMTDIPVNDGQQRLLEFHMKHIEQSESDDYDEDDDLMFYDAKETLDDTPSSSESCYTSYENLKCSQDQTSLKHMTSASSDDHTKILLFVVQGGCMAETESDADVGLRDFETFENIFMSICNLNCHKARSAISFKLIQCGAVSHDIVDKLKALEVSPREGMHEQCSLMQGMSNGFPFSSIPLLLTHSANFQETVDTIVSDINEFYGKFMTENEGQRTNVYILADSVGGLLVYKALSCNDIDDISICSDVASSVSTDSEMLGTEQPSNLDFTPNGMFLFGSPVGLTMLASKLTGKAPQHPRCRQIYNMFHPFDPMSSRIEPMLDASFGKIKPAPVPRSQAFPYNSDIQYNYTLLYEVENEVHLDADTTNRLEVDNNECKRSRAPTWWGTKRIDYMIHCPEGLQQFPVQTLLHLCYNSYWESKDLVAFILWQILEESNSLAVHNDLHKLDISINLQPKEKWLKKRTKLKIKNMRMNHRANDIIGTVCSRLTLEGKFAYGPVELAALSSEKVDVYIATRPNVNDWQLLCTDITDAHGRFTYAVPTQQLGVGIYAVQMVVRGDHSHVDCTMAIVPSRTDAVVFSIDGSFLASYSLRGIDPKIRGGAVDVVRYWQELGYLIIYVSSRLIYQKEQVRSWLSQHNFPFGIVSFCENLSTDFHKHKIEFLKELLKQECVNIHAAYGSSRDIPVYVSALKLPPNRIFLIGKKHKSKKLEQAQWITEGYTIHLTELKHSPLSIRSLANKNMYITQGHFDYPDTKNRSNAVKKKKLRKSSSSPVNTIGVPTPEIEKTERSRSFIKLIRSRSKGSKEG